MFPLEGLGKLWSMVADSITPAYSGAVATCDLFKNNIVVDQNTVFGDLTLADFSGYAPLSMDASGFGEFPSANGIVSSGWLNPFIFTHNGGGTGNTIYGSVIHRDGLILSCRNIPSTVINTGGQTVQVLPIYGAYPTDPPITPPVGVPLNILAWDTFTDADGTNLASHTPEGRSPWTQQADTFQINSNTLGQPNADGLLCLATQDLGTNVLTALLKITTGPGTDGFSTGIRAGFVFRFVDINNFYIAYINSQNGTFNIDYRLAGVDTAGVSGNDGMLAASTSYLCVLQLTSSNAQLTLIDPGNGSPITLGANLVLFGTATKHGIYTYQDSTIVYEPAVIDDYRVTVGSY